MVFDNLKCVLIFLCLHLMLDYKLSKFGLNEFYVMADVNTESEVLIKNKILCYIQNYFDKSPSENIIAAIVGFYSGADIESAKSLIADIADVAKNVVDKGALSGALKRRAGQGKRKMEVEDILTIYDQLDKNALSVPTFVVGRLKRIPMVSPTEVDVCALAANVNVLQLQMDTMVKTVKKLVKVQNNAGVEPSKIKPKSSEDGRPTWAAMLHSESKAKSEEQVSTIMIMTNSSWSTSTSLSPRTTLSRQNHL